MEVFAWAEKLSEQLNKAGQPELARQIFELPVSAVAQHSPGWESIYLSVLAASRELENPWLEAYAHHWAAQSRVSRDGEGRTALNDVISAVERSHQPDCIECPQAVCLVQDLATVYSVTDRSGYIEERLGVVDETLARIDKTWTCFHCLNRERADALNDAGRYEEALVVLDESDELMRADGEEIIWHSTIRPNALIELGRVQEALDWMVEADNHDDDEEDATWFGRQIVKAYALALLDRVDEADDVIPPSSDVVGGDYRSWVRAAEEIIRRGKWDNDWQYGATLRRMTAELIIKGNGAAVELAEIHCRRAVERKAGWTARQALEQFGRAQQILRDPHRVDPLGDELRAIVEGLGVTTYLPVDPLQLVEFLADNRDPEKEIDLLLLARQEASDDDAIAQQVVRALFALGEAETAKTMALEALEEQPGSEQRAREALSLLKHGDDEDGQRKLAERIQITLPELHHWILVDLASGSSEWSEVIKHCEQIISINPQHLPSRRRWAQTATKLRDFATSFRLQNEVIEILKTQDEDTTSDMWDLLSYATLAGEWETVRARATALGMTLDEGTGPIDEEWAFIKVAYDELDKDGDRVICTALRTGPVTGRVMSVMPPPYPVKTGDLVVFDAAPLNPKQEAVNQDEEDDDNASGDDNWMPVFQVIGIINEGNMASWVIDGPTPEGDGWDTFRNEIRESGWGLWALSSDSYMVTNPDAGHTDAVLSDVQELPGVFAALAVPAGVTPLEVHHRLVVLTQSWERPVAWLRLAEAAGLDQHELDRQQKIVDDYNL